MVRCVSEYTPRVGGEVTTRSTVRAGAGRSRSPRAWACTTTGRGGSGTPLGEGGEQPAQLLGLVTANHRVALPVARERTTCMHSTRPAAARGLRSGSPQGQQQGLQGEPARTRRRSPRAGRTAPGERGVRSGAGRPSCAEPPLQPVQRGLGHLLRQAQQRPPHGGRIGAAFKHGSRTCHAPRSRPAPWAPRSAASTSTVPLPRNGSGTVCPGTTRLSRWRTVRVGARGEAVKQVYGKRLLDQGPLFRGKLFGSGGTGGRRATVPAAAGSPARDQPPALADSGQRLVRGRRGHAGRVLNEPAHATNTFHKTKLMLWNGP